jgi:hypothetical protein
VPELRVDVGGGLRLANPVIAASGTFGYGVEYGGVTDPAALGAVVVILALPLGATTVGPALVVAGVAAVVVGLAVLATVIR